MNNPTMRYEQPNDETFEYRTKYSNVQIEISRNENKKSGKRKNNNTCKKKNKLKPGRKKLLISENKNKIISKLFNGVG
ncbi:hypothetical protein WN48_03679 [Eufriesea mexicana]|nr:hypothetical protein WN48_03679 [Eufriesea mexicana]